MAATYGAIIWTADPNDIHALVDAQDVSPLRSSAPSDRPETAT